MTSHVQPDLLTWLEHFSIISRFTTGGISDWLEKETSGFQSGSNLMRNAQPALRFGYFYTPDVTETGSSHWLCDHSSSWPVFGGGVEVVEAT